jgi:hypothetical protein
MLSHLGTHMTIWFPLTSFTMLFSTTSDNDYIIFCEHNNFEYYYFFKDKIL